MSRGDFERRVFVNCPFSPDYRERLRAIVFVLLRLGFEPCLASQKSDSGHPRIEEIKRLISGCRHGIHDLSLSVAAKAGAPTRMNMPYELGLDLGARWFGPPRLRSKVTLVLEKKRGSAKKALSDMDFGDPRAYNGVTETLICELRDHFFAFLSTEPGRVPAAFPSHDELLDDWTRFVAWLQQRADGSLRSSAELERMAIPEFMHKVTEWLGARAFPAPRPRP